MDDETSKKRFTVRLDFTVFVPEEHTHTAEIEAEDADGAIYQAWCEVYDLHGCDEDELEERGAKILKEVKIIRGGEDDQTLDMFSK